jgi:Intracellular proteinase inhibitor
MWRGMVVLVALTLVLSGCYGPLSASSVGGDVEVQLWASTSCAQPGDTVHLRATATNRGNRIWTVDTKGEPVFDIITSSDDKPVRWSDGKPLTPALTHLELKPGESKTIEMDISIPKTSPPSSIAAKASFISSAAFSHYPTSPGVTINVWNCPSALGP